MHLFFFFVSCSIIVENTYTQTQKEKCQQIPLFSSTVSHEKSETFVKNISHKKT